MFVGTVPANSLKATTLENRWQPINVSTQTPSRSRGRATGATDSHGSFCVAEKWRSAETKRHRVHGWRRGARHGNMNGPACEALTARF
jgi:hypothetical protein